MKTVVLMIPIYIYRYICTYKIWISSYYSNQRFLFLTSDLIQCYCWINTYRCFFLVMEPSKQTIIVILILFYWGVIIHVYYSIVKYIRYFSNVRTYHQMNTRFIFVTRYFPELHLEHIMMNVLDTSSWELLVM